MTMQKKKLSSNRNRPEIISSIITIIVAITGFLAAVLVNLYSSQSLGFLISPGKPTPTPFISQDVSKLMDEISSLRNDVSQLKLRLDIISTVPTESTNAFELSQIKNSIGGLNTRLEVIEQSVIENPEKALSLILLKKDMQALQDKYLSNTELIQNEINRVSGLNQALIILVMTSMVGLVGLAIGNLFQIRRSERNQSGSDTNENNGESVYLLKTPRVTTSIPITMPINDIKPIDNHPISINGSNEENQSNSSEPDKS